MLAHFTIIHIFALSLNLQTIFPSLVCIKLNFWSIRSTEEDNSLLTIVCLLLSAAASSSLLWNNYQLSITVSSPQSSSQCGSTRRCVAHVLQYSCRPFLLNPIFPRSIIVGKKVFRSKVMSLASRHPLCYITRMAQLDLTSETKVFHMLFERSLYDFSKASLKQHTEYCNFRRMIQLDRLVHCTPRFSLHNHPNMQARMSGGCAERRGGAIFSPVWVSQHVLHAFGEGS